MAEHVPHLFGRVRRERRDHQDQRVDRLAQHGDGRQSLDPAGRWFAAPRPAVHGGFAERVQLVDELHQRRHRGVQVHPLFDVARHAADRVVRLPPERLLGVGAVGTALGDALAADGLRPVIDEPPDAHQEPEAALEARVAPLDFLLRRRDEHHVQPQRVGAVFLQHVVGIDDVALGLRHHGAALEHHALRQQALERLVEVDQPDVAQHAREEARVQQVEDGMLDAAAVEIDRHPVGRLQRVERQHLVRRIGEAQEIPGRVDERVHGVGFPPGRAAARRALHVHPFRHLRQG